MKRELACAAGPPSAAAECHSRLSQERRPPAGGVGVRPSHQGSPVSSEAATLVKMALELAAASAMGLVLALVPGATPKKPASGLHAHRRPSAPSRSQAMSSPTTLTDQPRTPAAGTSIARFVLPQADGKAPQMYLRAPDASCVSSRMSMCSASQPSSRATADAMRSARHFLPSSALPP